MPENSLIDSLLRYVGQTVTIFTTSGGISGGGFTGTLVTVSSNTVRLITDIGAPPACPIGSSCFNTCNGQKNQGPGPRLSYNWLGSITEIPISRIASFTHNAI